MDALAKSRRWHVVEFARPHCPFSFSEPAPTEAGASDCVAYNQRVVAWLAAHPDVTSVFVSNNARLPMAEKGMGYKVQGHVAALRALPPSVTRTFVLRDTPTDARVDARLHPPRGAPQAHAGHAVRDPAQARPRDATRPRSPRSSSAARVIDLTPFFCSSKECFPVVGGVLVHKDQDHLTQTFCAHARPATSAARSTARASCPRRWRARRP